MKSGSPTFYAFPRRETEDSDEGEVSGFVYEPCAADSEYGLDEVGGRNLLRKQARHSRRPDEGDLAVVLEEAVLLDAEGGREAVPPPRLPRRPRRAIRGPTHPRSGAARGERTLPRPEQSGWRALRGASAPCAATLPLLGAAALPRL